MGAADCPLAVAMFVRMLPMVDTMLVATGTRAAAVGMSILDRELTRLCNQTFNSQLRM